MGKKRPVYRQRNHRRHTGKQQTPRIPVLRAVLIAAVVCLACTLRFSDDMRIANLRETVTAVLQGDTDYREAIEVFGRVAAGERETSENALMVFGKKVLGLDEMPQETERESADEAAEPTAGQVRIRQAGEPLSGLSLNCTVMEAPMPSFVPSADMSGTLLWEEADDTTPDIPFQIPSPDNVDDGTYDIPFAYTVPVFGRVTSRFGYRIHPISGNTTFHHGADIAAAGGTPVACFADGAVCETGYSAVYGNYVKVQHAGDFLSFYAHLSKINVKEGKRVSMGDQIGKVGNTGYSTGAHLHFELRRQGRIIDPFDYLSFDREIL